MLCHAYDILPHFPVLEIWILYSFRPRGLFNIKIIHVGLIHRLRTQKKKANEMKKNEKKKNTQ